MFHISIKLFLVLFFCSCSSFAGVKINDPKGQSTVPVSNRTVPNRFLVQLKGLPFADILKGERLSRNDPDYFSQKLWREEISKLQQVHVTFKTEFE
ncbi:MAG: hypothetical protein HY537_10780, partial [Deltaproteobacteria bacterium]|nr:hypothetical protein [Deltaproteobacteria bacterium]